MQLPGTGGLQVLAGGQAVEHVHDAAVGHQCNLAAHVLRGQAVYRVLNATAQHGQRFAAAIGHKVRVALAPAQGLLRLLGLDFLEGAPLKAAKAALAQACIGLYGAARGLAYSLRRTQCALQVAAVDGIQALIRQRSTCALGLPQADVVERNVQMPLDAGVHVPGGFAVAYGNDAGSLHAAKWASRPSEEKAKPTCLPGTVQQRCHWQAANPPLSRMRAYNACAGETRFFA